MLSRLKPILTAFLCAVLSSCSTQESTEPKHCIGILQEKLQTIADSCPGEVGLALIIDCGDTITIDNECKYPLMSVFKMHQAFATLKDLELKGMSVDSVLSIPRFCLNPSTWSPMLKDYTTDTLTLELRTLLAFAIEQSDNNASNYLFRHMMGIAKVDSAVSEIIPRESFQMLHTEAEMQTDHVLAYENRTTPLGAAILIDRLFTDSVLAGDEALDILRAGLKNCKTGVDRISAPLQNLEGVSIAHKTGSGFRDGGILAAHNDVAFIELPSGRHYTLAVFIKDFSGSEAEASQVISEISDIIYHSISEE